MKKQKKAVKETLVNFILDKSGSMESIKSSTVSGFNEYLGTLKKDGNKYSFSLTLFDTNVERVVTNEPISKVDELSSATYNPDGMTALYDAVCQTIKCIKEKKDQKVINIIMTDGQENSSREYTEKEMKSLIEEKEKQGNWTFVYLGANQDSYAVAQKYGIAQGNTVNFTASNAGMRSAMGAVSMSTSNFASDSSDNTTSFFASSGTGDSDKISQHFSSMGKKSWEKRKNTLLSK